MSEHPYAGKKLTREQVEEIVRVLVLRVPKGCEVRGNHAESGVDVHDLDSWCGSVWVLSYGLVGPEDLGSI